MIMDNRRHSSSRVACRICCGEEGINRGSQALINSHHLVKSQINFGKCFKFGSKFLYINVGQSYSKSCSYPLCIVVFEIMKEQSTL